MDTLTKDDWFVLLEVVEKANENGALLNDLEQKLIDIVYPSSEVDG